MANQPIGRPWFRLASLRPVAPPPPPAPAQESRFSLIQPSNRINSSPERKSVTSSPTTQKPPAQSSSPPTSPLKSISSSASSSSSPIHKPSPPSSSASSPARAEISPSTKHKIHTIMQSQNQNNAKFTTPQSASSSTKQVIQKSTITPPSPLTLPPAHFKANSEPKIPKEAESKSVISLQKHIENPKHLKNDNYSGEKTINPKNHIEKEQFGNHRKSWSSKESHSPMKVITIAGENKGACMELIQSSPNKNGVSRMKSESGESRNTSSESDEGNGKRKDSKNNRKNGSMKPMSAFMNSNVQCVNNSILYNASCSHKDPGVRFSLTRKPFERDGFHFKKIN